jgi:hypothetical protein
VCAGTKIRVHPAVSSLIIPCCTNSGLFDVRVDFTRSRGHIRIRIHTSKSRPQIFAFLIESESRVRDDPAARYISYSGDFMSRETNCLLRFLTCYD